MVASGPAERDAEPSLFPVPQLVGPGERAARPELPSFLYAPLPGEDPDGDAWIVGEHARRRGQEVPARLVASSKSWLCHGGVDRTAPILPWGAAETDDEAVAESEPRPPRLSPVDAAARVLAHVRRAWDDAHPDAPLTAQRVVVTVPASFDAVARELTLVAARSAGLAPRLLEEPQAAFYDWLRREGARGLERVLGASDAALVLVCDVGGGTTDLTLIRVARAAGGEPIASRIAVGRHILLGGDNVDLALAHQVERRLVAPSGRLDARRFAALVLACRAAKERLLDDVPPEDVPIAVAGTGSALVGGTLSARLAREHVERIVFDGFLPIVPRDAVPERRGAGLVAFGLPYERDAAITRHLAAFFARHAPDVAAPRALLLNGGPFRSARIRARLAEAVAAWGGEPPLLLAAPEPSLAVATGAVAYAQALEGRGTFVGGGAPRGWYVGLEAQQTAGRRGAAGPRRALCVVPRGAQEGERQVAGARRLGLVVGRSVRFELFASDSTDAHAPGDVVEIDEERFDALAPVAVAFDAGEARQAGAEPTEIAVVVEGELSAVGTLELECVEAEPPPGRPARRYRLAFDVRASAEKPAPGGAPGARSERPPRTVRGAGQRLDEARDAVDRAFGKPRADASSREARDLWRELERLLGERARWTSELSRALFDALVPLCRARRRSPDHERVFWMLAGWCLRPGFGDPLDRKRAGQLVPLWAESLAFPEEARGWAAWWVAWRRCAGGLDEPLQQRMRDALDPWLAPEELKLKKPKGPRPQAAPEMLELAAALERVPSERRATLGRWVLERTWTDRDPRLWAALGRIGARVPAYASVHHVVSPRTVERWIDHLLRERWEEMPSAARAARDLGRVTGDRARDVAEPLRLELARRLQRAGADAEWVRSLREHVPVEERERAELLGDSLPAGLRLVE